MTKMPFYLLSICNGGVGAVDWSRCDRFFVIYVNTISRNGLTQAEKTRLGRGNRADPLTGPVVGGARGPVLQEATIEMNSMTVDTAGSGAAFGSRQLRKQLHTSHPCLLLFSL